eukprot:scaffold16916_cov49-Phaeocystis_antarctica.AAC.9
MAAASGLTNTVTQRSCTGLSPTSHRTGLEHPCQYVRRRALLWSLGTPVRLLRRTRRVIQRGDLQPVLFTDR